MRSNDFVAVLAHGGIPCGHMCGALSEQGSSVLLQFTVSGDADLGPRSETTGHPWNAKISQDSQKHPHECPKRPHARAPPMSWNHLWSYVIRRIDQGNRVQSSILGMDMGVCSVFGVRRLLNLGPLY
jgi:hypothetical protein